MPKKDGVQFRRKSKWMKPPLVDTLKRLVIEVRLGKKSLQKLALGTTFQDAKGRALKIPERTLRRYVDLSKDDARQDSGLYIPLQPDETLSKELQRKKKRREMHERQMQEQELVKLQKQANEKRKEQVNQKLEIQQQKALVQERELQEREMQKRKHEPQKEQKKKEQNSASDASQTERSPAKRARTRHPQQEHASESLPVPNMSHILPQFSPPLSSGSMKLPISSSSPWTNLTPATLKTPLSELRTFDEVYCTGLPQAPFERLYSCSSIPSNAGVSSESALISGPLDINSPIDLPVTSSVAWDTSLGTIDADGSFCS